MLNKSEAKRLEQLLDPVLGVIHEVILDGFRYRQTQYAEEVSNHSKRTRASLTNDLIVKFAKQKLLPHGVKVIAFKGRVLFNIKDQLILHFKKLNRQLLSSNYQTEFAIDFNRQRDLPGIPSSLPRLVAGYVASRDWASILGAFITLPNGDEVEWSMELKTKPALEIKSEEPNDQGQQRRFRPKGGGGDTPRDETGTGGKH